MTSDDVGDLLEQVAVALALLVYEDEAPVMFHVMQRGAEGTLGIAVHCLFASAVEQSGVTLVQGVAMECRGGGGVLMIQLYEVADDVLQQCFSLHLMPEYLV